MMSNKGIEFCPVKGKIIRSVRKFLSFFFFWSNVLKPCYRRLYIECSNKWQNAYIWLDVMLPPKIRGNMFTFLLRAALWSRFAIWHFIKRRDGPPCEADHPGQLTVMYLCCKAACVMGEEKRAQDDDLTLMEVECDFDNETLWLYP